MKEKYLEGREILSPEEGFGDIRILNIYFNLARNNHEDAIPPTIAVKNEPYSRNKYQKTLNKFREEYSPDIEELNKKVENLIEERNNFWTITDSPPEICFSDEEKRNQKIREFRKKEVMKKFEFKGTWRDFNHKWNNRELGDIYIANNWFEDYPKKVSLGQIKLGIAPLEVAKKDYGYNSLREKIKWIKLDYENKWSPLIKELVSLEEQARRYENALKKGRSYLLVDGTHKSFAQILAGKKIRSYILEEKEDVDYIRKMIKEGYINDFDFEDNETPEDFVDAFYNYVGNAPLKTLEQRVKELKEEDAFPKYMLE